MSLFDTSIISFFHQISLQFPQLSRPIMIISNAGLLKGGVISALLWWLWFQPSEFNKLVRDRIISILIISGISIILGKVLATLLPFRIRPFANPEIGLAFPYAFTQQGYEWASSFPSDHAILFFSMATGIYLCSRFLGSLAFFHAIVFVCLPRIYLGLHYPTDILAGGLIGVGMGLLVNKKRVRHFIVKPFNILLIKNPSLFYASFFLLTYQIADMFTPLRSLLGILAKH